MRYPTKDLEFALEKDLKKRIDLYLKTNTIEEYKIERDMECMPRTFDFTDELVAWYLIKERKCMVIFKFSLVVLGLACALTALSILLKWSLFTIVPIPFIVVVSYAALHTWFGEVEKFGNTAVWKNGRRYAFKDLDDEASDNDEEHEHGNRR